MTRCGPSQRPEEACWSPSVNILGGGNISATQRVPQHPKENVSALPRGTGFPWVCRARVSALLRGPTSSLAPFSVFQYWAFSDIQTGRVLTKVTDETSGCCKLSQGYWVLSLHLLFIVYFHVLFAHLFL